MAQRKSSTKGKAKKRKQRTKKGKVYINPYKIVILCAAVIALCMGLLVVSTAINQKHQAEVENQIKIEKQLEEEKIKEEKRLEAEKKEAEKKRIEKEQAAKKLAKEREQKKLDEERKLKEEKKIAEQKKLAEQKKAEEAKKIEQKKQEEKRLADEKKKKEQKPAEKKPENTKREEPVRTPNTETKLPPAQTNVPPSPATVPPAQPAPASKFDFPQAKNGAQLVILLDDGGQNLAHLQKFLDLPFPITIAVLPQLAHSKESAAKIRAAKKELMLHQPMQAVNESVNPGPGAITPNMDAAQIKATLYRNISEIAPIAGFNNHEGSLITADAEKMETVLKYASENGIYFLDSRTNVKTSVPAVASALGLSYYERNGRFLDNVKTRENAITEIRRNLDIANRDGVVIMIGHIWSADFLPAALMEVYPELVEKGYTFKTVSECRGQKR